MQVKFDGQLVELGDVLGTGASGVVHAAMLGDGRMVAVKLIHKKHCNSSEAVSRFAREITALSKIPHPNVVQFYGHGETKDGRIFIVMELLQGEPLSDWIQREAPLPPATIIPLLLKACDALVAAHSIGLVHRDIKPENLFVVRKSTGIDIKLMDFGFVRFSNTLLADEHSALTNVGSVLGTPGFMSPEQVRGEQATELSDVYAFASTVYECLTGKIPFDGDSSVQIMNAQATEAPIPLNERVRGLTLPPLIAAAVMHGLARDPRQRTPSARALADELRAALDGRASVLPPVVAHSQTEAQAANERVPVGLVAAVVVAVILVLVAGYFAFGAP